MHTQSYKAFLASLEVEVLLLARQMLLEISPILVTCLYLQIDNAYRLGTARFNKCTIRAKLESCIQTVFYTVTWKKEAVVPKHYYSHHAAH